VSEELNNGLRCRPGDLARVIEAWNPALIGRLVLVGASYSATEWHVTLLGEAGFTLTKQRRRMTICNSMLAYDRSLEPLRGEKQQLDHGVTAAYGEGPPHRPDDPYS
jgi:hypothetical protein